MRSRAVGIFTGYSFDSVGISREMGSRARELSATWRLKGGPSARRIHSGAGEFAGVNCIKRRQWRANSGKSGLVAMSRRGERAWQVRWRVGISRYADAGLHYVREFGSGRYD